MKLSGPTANIQPFTCLLTLYPEIAKQWHPYKNSQSPSISKPFSNKKAWWICDKGHEWQAIIASRKRGNGCPYCSGLKANNENCLNTAYPRLVSEWHPTLNGLLTPQQVTSGSKRKVWWMCSLGHEWRTSIQHRTSGGNTNCPHCYKQSSDLEVRIYSELRLIFPNIIHRHKEYGKELDLFLPEYRLGIEIDGAYYHKNRVKNDLAKNRYFQSVDINLVRIREYPLLKMSNIDINFNYCETALTVIHRLFTQLIKYALCTEYHHKMSKYIDKNNYINDIYFQENRSKLLSYGRHGSLLDNSPFLVSQWHPSKNISLKPSDVAHKSGKSVWWLCDKSHEWQAIIRDRVAGNNCPYCSNQKTNLQNCLSSNNPSLAREWHPFKNVGLTAYDVTPGSNKKVWWRCSLGHEWMAQVIKRDAGHNCPYCAGKKVGERNNLAFPFPNLAAEWHTLKNGTLQPNDIVPGSGKKVWWRCAAKHEHEWETQIFKRAIINHGCPYCSGRRKWKNQ